MSVKRILSFPLLMLWHAFFWTYDRATWQYDLWVVAILAFMWLVPPGWLGDPMAHDAGPIAWIREQLR